MSKIRLKTGKRNTSISRNTVRKAVRISVSNPSTSKTRTSTPRRSA